MHCRHRIVSRLFAHLISIWRRSFSEWEYTRITREIVGNFNDVRTTVRRDPQVCSTHLCYLIVLKCFQIRLIGARCTRWNHRAWERLNTSRKTIVNLDITNNYTVFVIMYWNDVLCADERIMREFITILIEMLPGGSKRLTLLKKIILHVVWIDFYTGY